MPFDRHDLFRQAGYGDGDFTPLLTLHSGNQFQTSSSTYSSVSGGQIQPRLRWDLLFPAGVQAQALLFTEADAAGDQIDVRVQNLSDSETVIEVTGTTADDVDISEGPVDYTPSTTGGQTTYILQIRNADNVTTVNIVDPTLIFGVTLA